jgi:tetratricopeptide (TPR) repeat protein
MLTVLAACPSAVAQIPPVFSSTPGTSTDPVQLQRAEQRFHEGKFREAGVLYAGLIAEGNCHADLLVNCGNAFFLAGDLPQAIQAYRKGLRRYPLDRDLWDNLELARDRVGYPGGGTHHRPPGDDWPPILPRAAPHTVLYLALGLHALAWIITTVWLMTRLRRFAVLRTALFAAAALMGIWWGILELRMIEDKRQAVAIVTTNGATLRRGNGSLYPPHPDLPRVNRGMEARLLNQRGQWVQVQFPGGEIGWLPQDVVLLELPMNYWRWIIHGDLMKGTTHH